MSGGEETALPAGVPAGFSAFNPRDDFVGFVGPLYIKPESDGLRVGFLIDRRHTNPMGVAHGGMMMTVADMALGIGCGYVTGLRFPHPTVSLNCDFMRGPKLGQFVEGTARIARRTRHFIFANCELTADGEVMLTASGVFKTPDPNKIPAIYRIPAQPA